MIYKFFKNVETVEELYSQYKKLAMQHHPDHGGRVENMQQINAEYYKRRYQFRYRFRALRVLAVGVQCVLLQRRIKGAWLLLLL